MFSGRRPGKRSIVGTRVCAPFTDGFYWQGVISAIQTAAPWEATADRYTVEFEDGSKRTFDGDDIIGAGFQTVTKDRVNVGQTVFITHNGREVEGTVERVYGDEVAVALADNGLVTVPVRIEDIRLMKSRRSARLSESQQDSVIIRNCDSPFELSYKRLRSTEVATPASRSWPHSHCSCISGSCDGRETMDEHMAALALTSLSCSPASPIMQSAFANFQQLSSRSDSQMSSGVWTMNSETSASASPPSSSHDQSFLSSSAPVDCFMQFDEDDAVDDVYMKDADSSVKRTVYQCTWRGCSSRFNSSDDVQSHIRSQHLLGSDALDDEDFYYTEFEETSSSSSSSSSPVHDVTCPADFIRQETTFCTPVAMDHDYQRKDYLSQPVNIVRKSASSQYVSSSLPMMSLSTTQFCYFPYADVDTTTRGLMLSPSKLPTGRKSRNGDVRKCRKVYGIENRSLWCTQCKWKKACSRFSIDFC